MISNEKEIDRGSQCYFNSPFEFGAYLRFVRTIDASGAGTKNISNDHLSTTLEADLYPAGAKVWVKHDLKKREFVIMARGPDDKKPKAILRWPIINDK